MLVYNAFFLANHTIAVYLEFHFHICACKSCLCHRATTRTTGEIAKNGAEIQQVRAKLNLLSESVKIKHQHSECDDELRSHYVTEEQFLIIEAAQLREQQVLLRKSAALLKEAEIARRSTTVRAAAVAERRAAAFVLLTDTDCTQAVSCTHVAAMVTFLSNVASSLL